MDESKRLTGSGNDCSIESSADTTGGDVFEASLYPPPRSIRGGAEPISETPLSRLPSQHQLAQSRGDVNWAERYALLAETAGELLRAPVPQDVIDKLCRKVMHHLDCQAFFNFLVDEKAGRLHLNAWAGVLAEEARRIEWLDFGVAVCGCAARSACRIVAEHIPSTPDPRTEFVRSYGITAYACHPLLDKNGRPIGTLSFGTKNRETFSEEDLALMRAVSDHVAVALVRVRDEQALKASHQKINSIIESVNDGFFALDRHWRFTYINKRAANNGGRSPEGLIGQCLWDEFPSLTGTEVERAYREAMEKRIPLSLEWQKSPSKTYQVSIYPSFDGITVHWTDTTERKRVENQLQYQADILQAVNNAVVVTDSGFRIAFWNKPAEALYGWTADEAIGRPISEIMRSAMPEDRQAEIREMLRDGRAVPASPVQLARDGTKVFVEGYEKPLRDSQGTITGFVTVIRDVSEQRKKEKELRRLNRTLQAMGRSNQALVRATDENAFLTEVCNIIVNDCGHTMVWIGYAEDDTYKTVRPVAYAGFEAGYLKTLNVSWADTERGRGPTGTAIRTGAVSQCRDMRTDHLFSPWRAEALKREYASSIVFPLADPSRVFGALTIYSREPDTFSADEVRLLSGLADDLSYGISTLRLRRVHTRAEEVLRRDRETLARMVEERTRELMSTHRELTHARRMSDIGRLASTIAHELRNPLSAIRAAAYNIRRKAQNPLLDKHLASINKKVLDSDNIIQNLLSFTRIKAVNAETVNLRKALTECLATIVPKYAGWNVELKKHFDCGPGDTIETDPVQFKILFNNILDNAFQALRDKTGCVTVTSARNGDASWSISVADTGVGMASDELEKIFEPFYTTKSKGTGLGLAVCREIVDMLDGRIEVKSGKGRGTVFTVTLPPAGKTPPRRFSAAETPAPNRQ